MILLSVIIFMSFINNIWYKVSFELRGTAKNVRDVNESAMNSFLEPKFGICGLGRLSTLFKRSSARNRRSFIRRIALCRNGLLLYFNFIKTASKFHFTTNPKALRFNLPLPLQCNLKVGFCWFTTHIDTLPLTHSFVGWPVQDAVGPRGVSSLGNASIIIPETARARKARVERCFQRRGATPSIEQRGMLGEMVRTPQHLTIWQSRPVNSRQCAIHEYFFVFNNDKIYHLSTPTTLTRS